MIKQFIPLIFTFALFSCTNKSGSIDYFGQTTPDTIPEIFAKDIVSVKGRFEHGISFTPDVQEVAFGILNEKDFSGKIYYSKRDDNVWMKPTVFEPLKNESAFLPYFTPDGTSLLYSQSRPDTNNGFTDIWIIGKEGNSWNSPQKMRSPLNSLSRESMACMTLERKIYFSSNRNGNGLADLYCSSLENGEYPKVEKIDAISSVRDEESIFVSPNDAYIIFSRYATDQNGPDLFISYRDSKGKWLEPTPLDSTINSHDWERRPFVTMGNNCLFFTKLTFDEKGLVESDIYWVNTKKVFKPFVFNSLPDITAKIGAKIEISVPADYFKDIDDDQLTYRLKQNGLNWLKFNRKNRIISGIPNQIGEFELIFMAIDKYSNTSEDKVKLIIVN